MVLTGETLDQILLQDHLKPNLYEKFNLEFFYLFFVVVVVDNIWEQEG